jgi:hypothetical protein
MPTRFDDAYSKKAQIILLVDQGQALAKMVLMRQLALNNRLYNPWDSRWEEQEQDKL